VILARNRSMQRGSRLLFLALVAPVSIGCGFPAISFLPADAGGDALEDARPHPLEAAASTDAASKDASSTADAIGDAISDAMSDTSAAAVADADAGVDAFTFEAGPDAPICDQDQDGFKDDSGACGGNDCDDHDPRANPGVTDFRTDPPTPVTKGDWNCNGRLEKQYNTYVSCPTLQLGGSCDAVNGFMDDPPCGTSSMFVQCASALVCAPGPVTMRVQGCR
jgi:hypothetical protein